jgi:predicted RNA-binding Zn-ribbon protein involved in translation (DUF1610 family)
VGSPATLLRYHLGVSIARLLLGWAALAQAPASGDIIWTCPVHREETSASEGSCPQCGKALVKTRVAVVWSCPVHALSEAEPGKCRVCGRELYPLSHEIAFTCPMHAEVRELEPGTCPICRMALVSSSTERPHQDHNPKHGGIFFMAPNAWHHIEGVLPAPGLFRVYLYDNFSEPIPAAGFQGRAVLKESFDPLTREAEEILAYPLLAAKNGSYLEARIPKTELPLEIAAKIRFEQGGPFERFDFAFASEPAPAPLPDPGNLEVPEDPRAIAAAILERAGRVEALVSRGAFGEIYVPALEAKDLALALETRVSESSNPKGLSWALRELVRSAWLLDDYGDLGNREKIRLAHESFKEACSRIASLHGLAP